MHVTTAYVSTPDTDVCPECNGSGLVIDDDCMVTDCSNCHDGLVRSPKIVLSEPNHPIFDKTKFYKESMAKPKVRFDLVECGMPEVIEQLAIILTHGATKYDDNNWQLAKTPEDMASIKRALYGHLNSYNRGEKIDKDSGERHLSHALCNLSFLLWHELKNEV